MGCDKDMRDAEAEVNTCRACGSNRIVRFDAEAVLSSSGLRGLDSEPLYLVEHPLVCLNCGLLECRIEPTVLPKLRRQAAMFS